MDATDMGILPDASFKRYSAKAEIDEFMHRFLDFARRDNAASRVPPEIALRGGLLTSKDLKSALEKLDRLFSSLDLEKTNAIQIEIQMEGLKSFYQERAKRDSQAIKDILDSRSRLQKDFKALHHELGRLKAICRKAGVRAVKRGRILNRRRAVYPFRQFTRHRPVPIRARPRRVVVLPSKDALTAGATG